MKTKKSWLCRLGSHDTYYNTHALNPASPILILVTDEVCNRPGCDYKRPA